jgi:hypothetical protein
MHGSNVGCGLQYGKLLLESDVIIYNKRFERKKQEVVGFLIGVVIHGLIVSAAGSNVIGGGK